MVGLELSSGSADVPLVDVHSHVAPLHFPAAPSGAAKERWPCMRCHAGTQATIYMGQTKFRDLDSRSWDSARRIDDMNRDGVAMQVLSPMPELLSYWMPWDDAELLSEAVNHEIANMVFGAPDRFRGLGTVPLQDPVRAAAMLPRIKRVFGLSGIEIGSNINGVMLGDPQFDCFWEAAASENLAIFVHALHPIAAASIKSSPVFTASVLFPIDVAMAASSLITAGVVERFPALRIGFSHGGGALGAILGRLDVGWQHSEGFGGALSELPSQHARRLFFDSNVYDPALLRYLAEDVAQGRIFVGTDYPYAIMQQDPAHFIERAELDHDALGSLRIGAAELFLAEDLRAAIRRL